MGRKNKKYYRNLHQQAYDRLQGMLAIGQSKKAAKADGTDADKIFSISTYKAYRKHIDYYVDWLQATHPEVRTIKKARRYVNEWLDYRASSVGPTGQPLSAWTLQLECSALCKLYQIAPDDPDRWQPPQRRRQDIKRSRTSVARDKHFSQTNNNMLIRFVKGTGCRRGVLEKLEGRDLWTRTDMETRVADLQARRDTLTADEAADLAALQDALQVFRSDQVYYVHHRRDKGGKSRYAPIIGPDTQMIVDRMRAVGPTDKVWQHVHSAADIHGYRADYATALYRVYARKIEDIPYDRVSRGLGLRYQSDVYACRGDERGRKLDRAALRVCSKALGHNRVCVVADNYLRGL